MSPTALSTEPLIAGAPLDAPIAWRAGEPLSRAQYLADVATLAERLPAAGHLLAITDDRYRFTVALGAAMQRGQCHLLPPDSLRPFDQDRLGQPVVLYCFPQAILGLLMGGQSNNWHP